MLVSEYGVWPAALGSGSMWGCSWTRQVASDSHGELWCPDKGNMVVPNRGACDPEAPEGM